MEPFISGSVVALVTPFESRVGGGVNAKKLEELVTLQAVGGTSAIVPCGTTGESPTLSHQEHDEVIEVVARVAKREGMKVIAGTGSNSTREAVRLTTHAKEVGVDACLIVAPYYNKPSPAGLIEHFKALNEIGVPLIVYNIPGRTGINISPDTLFKIADECPHVVGLKASNGNLDEITAVAAHFKREKRSFSILSGDDSLTLPILAVGGVGVVSVVANLMPAVMTNLVSAFLSKNVEEALCIMHAIHGFCIATLQYAPNPAPIKALMNQCGFGVGECRLPLVGLDTKSIEELSQLYQGVIGTLSEKKYALPKLAA
jgi:4-hydroxy-tetrahydrodipicolinate synthase